MFDEANSILADTPWGDLGGFRLNAASRAPFAIETNGETRVIDCWAGEDVGGGGRSIGNAFIATEHGVTFGFRLARPSGGAAGPAADRSEEHTSELQSLMRISYAVFCLKKKNYTTQTHEQT